jgi:hypothetical protein
MPLLRPKGFSPPRAPVSRLLLLVTRHMLPKRFRAFTRACAGRRQLTGGVQRNAFGVHAGTLSRRHAWGRSFTSPLPARCPRRAEMPLVRGSGSESHACRTSPERPAGVTVDLARALAALLGAEVEFLQCAWAGVAGAAIADGRADIGCAPFPGSLHGGTARLGLHRGGAEAPWHGPDRTPRKRRLRARTLLTPGGAFTRRCAPCLRTSKASRRRVRGSRAHASARSRPAHCCGGGGAARPPCD